MDLLMAELIKLAKQISLTRDDPQLTVGAGPVFCKIRFFKKVMHF